jgi:hypothetical protein
MAIERDDTGVQTSSDVEIRMIDGEELVATLPGDEVGARGDLAALHERLVDERFVGGDTS